jgi:hypothetical protein
VGVRKINQNIFTLWGVAGGRRKINQNIFYSLSGESSDIFLKTRSYKSKFWSFLGRFLNKSKKSLFLFAPISIVVIFGAPKYRDIILSKHSPFNF